MTTPNVHERLPAPLRLPFATPQPLPLPSRATSSMALSSLPTELIEQIAEYLDARSIRSFRLTDLALSQKSLHAFKQRLRRRTLQWDIESLWQLEWMTSHPPFYGILEEIVIDATPRFAIRLWELEKSIVDAAAQQDFQKRAELQSSYLRIEEQSSAAARFWNETRQDQKILSSVFGRLKTLSSITFVYDGMNTNHLFARKYCENSQNEMSRPFVSTMAALATSHLPVQSIAVAPDRRFGAISVGRLESISPVLTEFDHTFPRLSHLQLSLRDWRYPDEGFEMPVGKVPFIVRFLSRFQHLRSLELSYFSSLEEDILPELAKHCQFRLETCKLDLFRVLAVENLFNFLEPCRDSLRSLSLSHIFLKDGTTDWDQVMRRIALNYRLDKVEFKSLFMQLGARVGFSGAMRNSLVIEGAGLTQELMHQAGILAGGNWGPAWHLAAVAYPFEGLRT